MSSEFSLRDYLSEVCKYPVLTKEAQLRHCRRIHAWVNHEAGKGNAPLHVQQKGRRSMDVMVRTNLRLVISIAKRYQGKGLDMLDLIQEGNIGLIRGLELFDPSRGYSVTTYVYWWVRQSINRALHNNSRLIRLPICAQETINKIQRYVAEHSSANGDSPTIDQIAKHLDIAPERVLYFLDSNQITHCSSLDSLSPTSDCPLGDLVPSDLDSPSRNPDAALSDTESVEFVDDLLATLPEAEAHVLRETYLNNRLLRDAAADLGVNRSRASTLRENGLRRIRVHLARRRQYALSDTP